MTGDLDRRRAERKLRSAARMAARALGPDLPPVLALTEPGRGADPMRLANVLPRGWGLVLRHFGHASVIAQAAEIARLCRRRGVVLLVANDAMLAHRLKADGVHWPEAALTGRHSAGIQTASLHLPRPRRRLQPQQHVPRLVSVVFPSDSPSAGVPSGPVRYRLAVRRLGITAYALGGVNAHNAGRIAGVGGVAAIHGIVEAFGL